MATTTNLNSLVINYLTQAQYDEAAANNTLNENQLYLTPTGITAADISRWNAKSNTDEKLKTEQQAAFDAYFPVLGNDNSTASTKFYNPYFRFSYDSNWAYLEVGDNNKTGMLQFGRGSYHNSLFTESLTANRQIKLPDKDGTIALTSDVSKTQLIRWTEV